MQTFTELSMSSPLEPGPSSLGIRSSQPYKRLKQHQESDKTDSGLKKRPIPTILKIIAREFFWDFYLCRRIVEV